MQFNEYDQNPLELFSMQMNIVQMDNFELSVT